MDTLFDIQLSKEDNLLKRFEEIHDFIYANDGLSPQQTLEEFVKILFIKIFDENEKLKQFSVSSIEWNDIKLGKNVSSFSERITALFDKTQKEYQDIFDTDDRIKLSQNALSFTVNKLQGISLLGSSQDAKGLAFQKFLSHHEKDGRGQFFTPEPVIDFCVGMNNPIGFAEINNIKGFDDCIAYGEYTGNPSAGTVSIYSRNKSGEWNIAYTFESGTIKHIHAIVPDHFRNNVLILTGDSDKESGFWVAENNFKTVRPLIFGEQRYRSCVAWPLKEGILYATDTPLENNYLFFISESNNWQPEIVNEMPGPCIFSAKIGDV
ncbi:MAG: SAM-dependent DNA methyltransferase, partial [Candidatus Moranbacteria bacterium]|nr:SAM-dependent DNA methyltransferase [Candidatus Moranbacteria bacterium]